MNRPPVFVADIDDASDLVLTLQEALDESMAVAGFDLGIARLLIADASALEAIASRGLRDTASLRDDQRVAVASATFATTFFVPDLAAVDGFLTFKREGARAEWSECAHVQLSFQRVGDDPQIVGIARDHEVAARNGTDND